MPRSRDNTVSCGCDGDEDEGGLDDFGLDDVEFVENVTPPGGFYSPDSRMGPEVGSPMNISGLVVGTPQDTVNIPSINVAMCYDKQGNIVPSQQYTEAEEDFLNRTIQSPESQSRRSSQSSYGIESPPGMQYKKGRKAGVWNKGNESDSSSLAETPEGFQYKKGRQAGLWNRSGTASGAGSPCSRSSESSYGLDSTPKRAQQCGNAGSRGGRPSTSPAGLIPTLRSERPRYARDTVIRPGQASLIPVPIPRSVSPANRFHDSQDYEESASCYDGARSARAPINFQQQNIDDLKRYPDPRYTYVPKHKFPGKSPSGAQRRSEPTRLRRDIGAADLDVSDIPIDANVHPHRKESIEPMVSGMLSHVCGSRRGPVEGRRPPIRGINQSIYGGRFTCPGLQQANTWLPESPSDDNIQVIHSPRPQSNLPDDEDDDLAEFEAYEEQFKNESIANKTSQSRQTAGSPEYIDLRDDSQSSSPNTSKKSCSSPKSIANKSSASVSKQGYQSPEFIDLCDCSGSSSGKGKSSQSPEEVDLCDDSIFEDMEKNVLEDDANAVAGESPSFYPNYSELPGSEFEETAPGFGDARAIERMVRDENNDVAMAVGLSVPSRVDTTLSQAAANISANSVRSGKSTVSAAVAAAASSRDISTSARTPGLSVGVTSASSRNTVTWGATNTLIPVMAEERDVDHSFAANMTMVQEQGLSLNSPPHQIANLLFPQDEGECQITAIIDSVPLEGAVVPMRPSRMRLPPATTEKMDELAVIADSFIRSAPDRTAGPQLNVTLGTTLNVPVVDLVTPDTTLDDSVVEVSPGSSPGRRTGKDVDPVEESRSIGAINTGRLVGETEFIMDPDPNTGTWIQLRGHREPNWFPGYYVSLPSLLEPVALMRTASEILPRAWYAAHSDSFQQEHQLSFSS